MAHAHTIARCSYLYDVSVCGVCDYASFSTGNLCSDQKRRRRRRREKGKIKISRSHCRRVSNCFFRSAKTDLGFISYFFFGYSNGEVCSLATTTTDAPPDFGWPKLDALSSVIRTSTAPMVGMCSPRCRRAFICITQIVVEMWNDDVAAFKINVLHVLRARICCLIHSLRLQSSLINAYLKMKFYEKHFFTLRLWSPSNQTENAYRLNVINPFTVSFVINSIFLFARLCTMEHGATVFWVVHWSGGRFDAASDAPVCVWRSTNNARHRIIVSTMGNQLIGPVPLDEVTAEKVLVQWKSAVISLVICCLNASTELVYSSFHLLIIICRLNGYLIT